MKRDTLISAEELVPWDGIDVELPALTIDIPSRGTTCLLGDDSQLVADYLRALAGIDDIHDGKLELFGKQLDKLSQQEWRQLRNKVGFVARTAPILSVLNGIENVILPVLYHKIMPRNEAEAEAHILLQQLACHANTELLPAYLSPLERTQLAIARAAIMKPEVLFLEEPYHELEVNEHNIINAFLKEWADERSLVISTRNLRFVKQQADQIVFAAENKILYFETWGAFSGSGDAAVTEYLQQYRENYSI